MKTSSFIDTRITGGKYRGRIIKSPNSETTHPMGSRERLAIMNSLGQRINDAYILDVYAGTGALGIEALSRGAKQVVFVEKNHKVADILKTNLKALEIENYLIVEKSAESYDYDTGKIDIVFFDPPYDKFQNFIDNFEMIFEKIKDNISTIVISHPKNIELNFQQLGDYEISTKTYAGASITIFTKKAS